MQFYFSQICNVKHAYDISNEKVTLQPICLVIWLLEVGNYIPKIQIALLCGTLMFACTLNTEMLYHFGNIFVRINLNRKYLCFVQNATVYNIA